MHVTQPREKITIKINHKDDLNSISSMQLDLVLPRSRPPKAGPKPKVARTEPLLVYELPAKIKEIIPLKEAKVEVKSIDVTVVKLRIY